MMNMIPTVCAAKCWAGRKCPAAILICSDPNVCAPQSMVVIVGEVRGREEKIKQIERFRFGLRIRDEMSMDEGGGWDRK